MDKAEQTAIDIIEGELYSDIKMKIADNIINEWRDAGILTPELEQKMRENKQGLADAIEFKVSFAPQPQADKSEWAFNSQEAMDAKVKAEHQKLKDYMID